MFERHQFDVIIAGGGLAGSAAAAALGEFGYRVLIVEPGLDNTKRLAGELIHPPGTTDLEELGLLKSLESAGGSPVYGFAVFPDAAEDGPRAYVLPYTEVKGMNNRGFAIEHAEMSQRLLATVEKLPYVTVWKGARVSAVNLAHDDYAEVTVLAGKQEVPLRTPLLIAADGRTSNIRKMAEIGDDRVRLSSMVGYVLKGGRLPHRGFGHVFVGGPAPALAYQIADDEVRVMFDIPDNPAGIKALEQDPAYLNMLPEPLRADVKRAMQSQPPLISANYTVTPHRVTKGRLVCVGDSGGCCHPLTATGISICTGDAMRLRRALREAEGDVASALRRYAASREAPARTRTALAEALYDAFTASTPAMTILRQGLLRYWQKSRRGRAASMALLSTHESRMSAMARQYASVVGYSLIELAGLGNGAELGHVRSRREAIAGLSRATLRYSTEALRGVVDGIDVPRTPAEVKRVLRRQLATWRQNASSPVTFFNS